MLRDLPRVADPRVLAGWDLADDAGVYRLTESLALVQTVDFFTPIVDDPYTFGAIAAANALSDVYAMGGTPITALNVTLYPTKRLPLGPLHEILRGGLDKATEAGVATIGGHTVDGEEPVYGLSVTGSLHPEKMIKPSGGQVGDVLVLTKPLGTGVVTTALKAGAAAPAHVDEAVEWMLRLNRHASKAMMECGVHAAKDVTGFGLLGHLHEMATAARVAMELTSASLPWITGAVEYAERGFVPSGGRDNEAYVAEHVQWASDVAPAVRTLMSDPQTSGGLVIAIPGDRASDLQSRLKAGGDLYAVIGRLVEGSPGNLIVR